MHLGLIGALLLLQALRWVPLPAAPRQLAVIELVLNDPGQGGAPRDRGQGQQTHAPPRPAAPAAPAAATPPPVPTPPATQPAAAASPAPSVPKAPQAALPPPVPDAPPSPIPKDAAVPPPRNPAPAAPTAAAAKATPSPPADSPPPAVRLGEDGESGETDEITGPRTAPPGPDPKIRNIPPRYPRGAMLRQEAGQVVMLLHINPAGGVTAADITRSSGSIALDSAAQEAALAWRFKPAIKDGLPVDSTLPYSITFELTAARGEVRR